MAGSFIIYPTGVVIRSSAAVDDRVDGDGEVDELYTQYKENPSLIKTWAFQEQIMRKAAACFGNFAGWLELHKNRKLKLAVAEAIYDTVEMINTKNRRMVSTEMRDVVFNLQVDNSKDKPVTLDAKKLKLDYSGSKFLWHWIMCPNGIVDILCTIKFLFGTKTA